jgi:protoheme IX farnesyltransferase
MSPTVFHTGIRVIVIRLRAFWSLVKGLQVGLLIITGLAGYISVRCPITNWQTLLTLIGSLFFAIGGSTILNMVYDRDIDLKMKRTCQRPIPSGLITIREALVSGLVLAGLGISWALAVNLLYGLVVLAGFFFDVVVYTMWLKRHTPWSIVWGGIAGGMPILAGRVLGIGHIDLIGLLLAISVLFWIPTHILVFSIKYAYEYKQAGVPVFPNTYGERATRLVISVSTGIAMVTMLSSAWLIGLRWGFLYAMLGLGAMLLVFTGVVIPRRSPRLDFALFKMASLYMLASSMIIIFWGIV